MADHAGHKQQLIADLLARGSKDDIRLATQLERMGRQEFRAWLRGRVKQSPQGRSVQPARAMFKGITTRDQVFRLAQAARLE